MATAEHQKGIVHENTRQIKEYNSAFGSIHSQQARLRVDRPASGSIWVSHFNLPAPPEPSLHDHLLHCMKAAGDGTEVLQQPAYASNLATEWAGPRHDVAPQELKASEPSLPERTKYERLVDLSRPSPVILYVQGGGHVFGSTVTARPAVKRLVQATGGSRILTVNYRLSPKDPLPAPLLDIAVAYFSLLSPPESAPHLPTPAESIVLVGESAGAALVLALCQFLLALRRNSVKALTFHGKDVSVQLPAGLALLSPAADFTQSLPSVAKATNDWLWALPPWSLPSWPEEAYWPADPPRGPIFCDWSAMCHPYISPVSTDDWSDAPPIYVAVGDGESLLDATRTLFRRAARQDVKVRLEVYEYMTHIFATTMAQLPQTKRVWSQVGKFAIGAVKGKTQCGWAFVKLGKCEVKEMGDVEDLEALDREQALVIMKRHVKAHEHIVYRGQERRSGSNSGHGEKRRANI